MSSKYHLETMRVGFMNMLKMHADRQASWYNIQHIPSQSSQNLSCYLGFNEDEYNEVLLALGFTRLRSGKVQLQRNSWEQLVASLNVEFPVLLENKFHKKCRGMLWIRLGCVPKNGEVYKPGKEPSTVKKLTFLTLERHRLLGGGRRRRRC